MGNGGTSDDGGKSAKIKTPKSLIPFHGFTPQLRFLRSCRPETRPNSESHRTRDTTTSHAHRPRVQGQLCSATATSPAPPLRATTLDQTKAEPPASVGVEHCLDVVARVVRCFREESTGLSCAFAERGTAVESLSSPSKFCSSLGVELPVQNSWEMYIYMFDFSSHSWTELSERVCVMGISMNLVTYLVGDLHLSSSKSANVVTNFMGTLNILGLLGGFLADAKLGRYLTIAIFASIAALDRSQNISLSDYGKSEEGKSDSDDEDGGRRKCVSGIPVFLAAIAAV
nr:protein NRT1/ PTR FAMILY 6.4-like [Ipomoea batatas]